MSKDFWLFDYIDVPMLARSAYNSNEQVDCFITTHSHENFWRFDIAELGYECQVILIDQEE